LILVVAGIFFSGADTSSAFFVVGALDCELPIPTDRQ
jgi:hypothetical protein